MSTDDSINNRAVAIHRRAASWLTWTIAILLLLLAVSYFVVKPFVERVVQSAGQVLVTIVESAAQAAHAAHKTTCEYVQQSAAAKTLLGEPITCAPVEQAEWLKALDPADLEFKFAVEGSKGAGAAHAIGKLTKTGFELKRLEIVGPAGEVVALPLP